MAVLTKPDGTVVAREIEIADRLLKKTLGLMFRRSIPENYAMIFDVCREQRIIIHMMFVPFPIDLILLDKGSKIVDIWRGLRPWTGIAFSRKPARYAVELPAGAADRYELKEGEMLDW